jgi:ketosteroid isomerase-like protein
MSQENVEAVRRFFTALSDAPEDREVRSALWETLIAEDVVYIEDPKWPGSDRYQGRDAVRACWEAYEELLGEAAVFTMEDIRAAGDEVVAIVEVAGEARESHVPYAHKWGYICRVGGGRLSYLRAYFDSDEAFEAAGLRSR